MPEALAIYTRFLRIGINAFGGSVSQTATLQRELVVNEKWTSNARFNRVMGVYEAFPGPDALKLATWLGACRAGKIGAIAAGLGFLTPGVALILLGTFLYAHFGLSPIAAAAFAGVQVAALAILCNHVRTLATRNCADSTLWFIAITAAATSLCGMHFGIILVLSTAASYLTDKGKNWAGYGLIGGMAFFTLMIFLWKSLSSQDDAVPIIAAASAGKGTPVEAILSGAKSGLLSFGGAAAPIPFLRDDAVPINNWATSGQFLDGVGITSILPTPLASLAAFVGFIGGGWPAALIMIAMVYLPVFALIFVGNARIERLVENEPLLAALDGAAAGVVGLVAAAAVLLFKATLVDNPANWPVKAAAFALALGAAIYFKPRWTNPAIILAAAVVGMLLLSEPRP